MFAKLPFRLLTFFFALIGYTSQGQVEFGLSIRPALTTLYGNVFLDTMYHAVLRPSFKVDANFSLYHDIWMRVGILFESKGAEGSSVISLRDANNQSTGESRLTLKQKFDYIVLPVHFVKRLGKANKLNIGFGFYTAYLVRQLSSVDGPGDFSELAEKTNQFKRFDFGISASLSANIPVSKQLALSLGFDDNIGLFDTSATAVVNNGSIKHNSFGAFVGLNYTLSEGDRLGIGKSGPPDEITCHRH